ncbi:MAG: hypothetical protein IPM18_05800 [Phycisphaerales bacterium]|nr:hypothetical protein [Phycisphaerales bacterium]
MAIRLFSVYARDVLADLGNVRFRAGTAAGLSQAATFTDDCVRLPESLFDESIAIERAFSEHVRAALTALSGSPPYATAAVLKAAARIRELARVVRGRAGFAAAFAAVGKSLRELDMLPDAVATEGAKRLRTGKRGRPRQIGGRVEHRILNAWATGHFRSYAECADELGDVREQDVRLVLDRHRKRERRDRLAS